jgi:hypothetical protein
MWYKINLISAMRYLFFAAQPAAPKFIERALGFIYSGDVIGHFDVFFVLRRNRLEKVI